VEGLDQLDTSAKTAKTVNMAIFYVGEVKLSDEQVDEDAIKFKDDSTL